MEWSLFQWDFNKFMWGLENPANRLNPTTYTVAATILYFKVLVLVN